MPANLQSYPMLRIRMPQFNDKAFSRRDFRPELVQKAFGELISNKKQEI